MIQLQVLNKVLKDGNYSFILDNNLSEDFFSDYKEEFKFIKEHFDLYNKVPDRVTFLGKFQDFDIVEVNESNTYLADALYKDRNRRYLATTFNKIRDLLNKGNVDDAMSIFMNSSDNMVKSQHIDCVDIVHDTSRFDKYVEKGDDYSKFYIRTGFKELDEVLGGWDRQEELAVIAARTNQGKCLAKGTEVLMADGTLKQVEDIKVGDRVQSINNKVNTVLALHNGVSNGYKITPVDGSGKPFTVSSDHILTLWRRNMIWDRERKMSTSNGEGVLVDMRIEDYLNLDRTHKALYRLYRAPVDYEEKEYTIPPRILGMWLGDGTSIRPEFTSVDEPLIEEWAKYAEANGCIARPNPSTLSFDITTGLNGRKNLVLENFRNCNVLNNKHIPLNYLTGSRQQRLELLAGLVDTDGWLDKKNHNYQIAQKSQRLATGICRLAASLGFKYVIKPFLNKKYNTTYYNVIIYGALEEVPVLLERKTFEHVYETDRPRRNPQTTGFKVEPVDKVEYYGFRCDGDERYLLSDNTVTHNTWILLKAAAAALEQGLTVGYYSGEMSETKVGFRFDTLISHISNSALTRGDRDVQNSYRDYIDNLGKRFTGSFKVLTPSMVGGSVGVSTLRSFIEREKLDILFVDQHSLLEDDRKGRSPVEKASNISKDLKLLQVNTHVPIISVSQQNREKNEEGPDTTNISQSDRIGQDATSIIFVTQDSGIMTLHLVKSRDSVNGVKFNYAIDLNKGIFNYIPSADEAAEHAAASMTAPEDDNVLHIDAEYDVF